MAYEDGTYTYDITKQSFTDVKYKKLTDIETPPITNPGYPAYVPVKPGHQAVIPENIIGFEVMDLLYKINDSLAELREQNRAPDYFIRVTIDVTSANTEELYRFDTGVDIEKLMILPVSHPVTLYVNNLSDNDRYDLNVGEGVVIERKCTNLYYTNTAASAGTNEIRIYVYGKMKGVSL